MDESSKVKVRRSQSEWFAEPDVIVPIELLSVLDTSAACILFYLILWIMIRDTLDHSVDTLQTRSLFLCDFGAVKRTWTNLGLLKSAI